MRLLLLIMTGIGFTLGLLCGLLLQLPADGLPHDNNNDGINIVSDANNDHSYRSRRSFSDDSAIVDAAAQKAQAQAHLPNSDLPGVVGGGWGGKPALQSAPNPEIAANPIVSGAEANNNRGPQSLGASAGLSGQGPAQAERRGSSVKGDQEGAKNGGEGYENKPLDLTPSPAPTPAPTKPVTSFTLRLKNTGEKFVVDSAVKRHRDEDTHVVEPAPVGGEGQGDTAIHFHNENTQLSSHTPNNNTSTLRDIVSGVVWSPKIENACRPTKGFEPKEISAWRKKAAGTQVVRVEEGCGRMQNRLITFKDGSRACARYRLNTDQIQGEVYSYYLARLLNITNLPPAVLLPVDTLSPQWRTVHLEMSMAQWADGRLVVLTQWLDDLTPSYIPTELREEDRKLHPTLEILGKKKVEELCDLLQWSDLIVFDYLTANLDRLVNNMFNKQWNAEMMKNPAHNLERTKGGSLVFLDNESGLFHGYRLLEKYHGYHESLLNSLCVFRESTARAVKVLHQSQTVGEELQKLFREGEVHHKHLPPIPEKNVNVLKERLSRVYDQIVKCEGMYSPR